MKKSLILLLLALVSAAAVASTDKARDMREAFARMDREDFLDGIEKADECTRQGKFSCADKTLAEIHELANGTSDEKLWKMASANLAAERQRAEDEERQRREAEDRERREEAQLIAEAEAEERRQQRAIDEENRRKALQIGLNNIAIAAAGKGLSSQQLSTLMDASTRDVMEGSGGSNMREATARLRADSERKNQQEMQRINEQRAQQRQREQETMQRAVALQRQKETLRSSPAASSAGAATSSAATAASGSAALASAALASEQKQDAERAARQQQEEKARLERKAQAEAEQKRLAAESALKEQERQKKLAQDKADREAKRAAEKARDEAEKREYLSQTAQKSTLKARVCYGKTYVVGIRPRIKPERVACVDMHYRASCPGSRAYVTGVVKNFVGIGTDCFTGDTADMEKMSCPAEDIRIEVVEAQPCGGYKKES